MSSLYHFLKAFGTTIGHGYFCSAEIFVVIMIAIALQKMWKKISKTAKVQPQTYTAKIFYTKIFAPSLLKLNHKKSAKRKFMNLR